jgi:hypothetical protein
MTRSDEPLFDPRIADWLEDDPHAAPDQALDVVLAAYPSIKQRRAWRVPWRSNTMSLPLRLAAATFIAAVVVGGGIYLLGPRAIGPGADASPTPVAGSPTPAPLKVGSLAPGQYVYDGEGVRVTISVPAGWEGGPFGLSKPPGELPNGVNMAFRKPTTFYEDPCVPDAGTVAVGNTVDDLVTYLVGLPNITAEQPEAVTISGFSGKLLRFTINTTGIDCVMAMYGQGTFIRAAENGQRQSLWILDVAGTRLVIDGATFPETSDANRAELETIVDTLQVEQID